MDPNTVLDDGQILLGIIGAEWCWLVRRAGTAVRRTLESSRLVHFFKLLLHLPVIMTQSNQVQVVIVGSGPAGLTAAIYCGRAGLNPIVAAGGFSPNDMPGGQVRLSPIYRSNLDRDAN